MAGPKFFRSHLGRAISFHDKVAVNALTAAAVVVRNRAKRNVRGGFTSGAYVSGNIINKIEHEVPSTRVALIGTTVDYGMYWELGHNNKITGRYERVEWLKPALMETRVEQRKAAVKAAKRTGKRFGIPVPSSVISGA